MGDVSLTFEPTSAFPIPGPLPSSPPPGPSASLPLVPNDAAGELVTELSGSTAPPPLYHGKGRQRKVVGRPRLATRNAGMAPAVATAPVPQVSAPGAWPARPVVPASPPEAKGEDPFTEDDSLQDDPAEDSLVRIGRLSERLDRIMGMVGRLRGQIKTHGGSVGALEGTLSTLQRDTNAARSELDAVRKDQDRADWIVRVMHGRLRCLAKSHKLLETIMMGSIMGYDVDPEDLATAQREVQEAERQMDETEEKAAKAGVQLPD